MRSRLFTPGPTEIPESVRAATARSMPYHRGPEFKKIFLETLNHLKYFFQTQQEVLVFTCSGSGGMEACVANLLSRGDRVVTIEGGKFGERWSEISRAFGLEVSAMKVEWGKSPDLEELKKLLQLIPATKAVFCTHSETSTGALTDVKAVAEIVRAHSEALFIVDGITSVGVLPFYFDDWLIDACVSGSQKGAMSPPGLAFVALSPRAWQRHRLVNLPRYYFDFAAAREAAREGNTAWTPAIPAILGLAESLRHIRQNGLEHYWKHYERLALATRAGMQALRLEIFPQHPSHALTAVKAPHGLDGKELVKTLREAFGVTIAGGQGHLKGKIFRVTHMGDYDHLDMIALMSALELALLNLGCKTELGAGLAAMQRTHHAQLAGMK
ncbi:MAG: pyridoxal-phosphate-dependent aminotransferase family protein [bacterium]